MKEAHKYTRMQHPQFAEAGVDVLRALYRAAQITRFRAITDGYLDGAPTAPNGGSRALLVPRGVTERGGRAVGRVAA